MKEVKLFHLEQCPYCHNAKRALEELTKENADYQAVRVEWIEESEQPEVAAQYNYYYVPTIFFGEEKLYEAHPSESYEDCKKNIQKSLDTVLAAK